MQLSALVYSVEKESFFTIIIDGKKEYFYLQRHLAKNFLKYLTKGTYLTFDYQASKANHRGVSAYKVNYFIEVSLIRRNNLKRTYYSLDYIRNGIKNLVWQMKTIMFLDFEMNMQDYTPINNFEQEIIEAGLILTDENGNPYVTKHFYIKPTKYKKVTHRAMKFLHYSNAELAKAVPFKVFYNELRQLVDKYNPYVVVWGKSDVTQLKKCLSINNCPDLNLHFINLLQLHANYDNLKDSPGLFMMWEKYNNTKLPEQTHDALEDAIVTKEVFFKFKEKIAG